MALGGAPRNKEIEAIQTAQLINKFSGGAVIGAWQVDDLPEELIITYINIANELPKMRAGINKNKKIMAEIKARHAKKYNARYSS